MSHDQVEVAIHVIARATINVNSTNPDGVRDPIGVAIDNATRQITHRMFGEIGSIGTYLTDPTDSRITLNGVNFIPEITKVSAQKRDPS